MTAISSGYCGASASFTLSGQYRRGRFLSIPHENVPLTLFLKRCTGPVRKACAHPRVGTVSVGEYCSDGDLEITALTTDCSGNYSITITGSYLAAALAVGPWVPNPLFSCGAPPASDNPAGAPYLPYVRDPATLALYGCPRDIGASGTALSAGFGDLINDETGGITDASVINGACGYVEPVPACAACQSTTGAFFVTRPTPVTVVRPGDGTVQYQTQALSGSYTLDFWDNRYGAGLIAYFVKDGSFYQVGGAQVTLTDRCGRSETIGTASYPGVSQIGSVDWPNIVSVTTANWTGYCSPPLYHSFAGPLGPLFVSGPISPAPAITRDISPVLPSLSDLCICSFPTFGVRLQTCTGSTPERLQADADGGKLAVAWSSAGAVKTAFHLSPTRQIGASTVGWEPTETVEASGADDLGMVYLPGGSLYLSYQLGGAALYRICLAAGETGRWSIASPASPAVSRHSDSGRAEGQAHRWIANGTLTSAGSLQFSQCRGNRSAWTAPSVVTSLAAGPYCGGAYARGRYVCLFTLAATVAGVGAAGELFCTLSSDGGATWSHPVFTGYSGYCSSVVCTAQGILVASVWGAGGTQHTGFLQSHNGGEGWQNLFSYGLAVPDLPVPPVLAAVEDTVFCVWVSGDQPQYLASTDGGVTWW